MNTLKNLYRDLVLLDRETPCHFECMSLRVFSNYAVYYCCIIYSYIPAHWKNFSHACPGKCHLISLELPATPRYLPLLATCHSSLPATPCYLPLLATCHSLLPATPCCQCLVKNWHQKMLTKILFTVYARIKIKVTKKQIVFVK